MSLVPGSRIGTYEITALLGKGGMGEVYRARDTRLGREVAIKVLPEAFTRDRDRVARFEREARILASLSHPNIAAIYGVADAPEGSPDGSYGLVLELVEGETLADRLARGPIPIDQALKIARQIAQALEAAHLRKIIHRDLKPANVHLGPHAAVKVLDFGLATALDTGRNSLEESHAETVTAPLDTTPGMILGTPAYMSPEQARGHDVDERTDIWAFGCVLYEMLTGHRTFPGATSADLVAAIVHKDPDWSALPAATPSLVRRLLRRCLQKDAQERVQHAGDLRLDLSDAMTPAESAAPVIERRRLPWWALAGTMVVISAAAFAFGVMSSRPEPVAEEVRFEMSGGVPISPYASIAVSPDGRQILVAPMFEQAGPGSELWLRPIDSITGRTLPGTTGAFLPFWSPDGGSIGFFANRKLWRLDLQSGVMKSLVDAPVGRAAAWAADGTILFAPTVRGPLLQVSADGGTPKPLTALAEGQNDHRAPQLLPSEQHFIYYARGTAETRGVFVARRDGTTVKRVIDADAPAVYTTPGHLLFVRETTLFAQPFDLDRLDVSGPAVPLAESIAQNRGVSLATLSASPTGTVAYGVSAEQYWQFAWFDRSGRRLASAGPNSAGGHPSLRPDGKAIALNRVMGGVWDIWIMQFERGGLLTRVTSDPDLDFAPVWTPDGRSVVFQSSRGGTATHLVKRSVDGSEPEQVILQSPEGKNPTDISRDGRVLLYDAGSSATATDVFALSLTGDPDPHPVVQTRAVEREGQFSPDGKWLAYSSNETSQTEVYVQPYPGPGPRVTISTAGGNQLRWSRTGGEIFFIDQNGFMNAVTLSVASPSTIQPGKPTLLFPTPFTFATQGPRAGYVVSEDGLRFLMNAPPSNGSGSTIAVIRNWHGTP